MQESSEPQDIVELELGTGLMLIQLKLSDQIQQQMFLKLKGMRRIRLLARAARAKHLKWNVNFPKGQLGTLNVSVVRMRNTFPKYSLCV